MPALRPQHLELAYGLDPRLEQRPCLAADAGALVGAYAVAHLVGGGQQFVFLPRHKIEAIRAGTKEGATRCLRANGIPFVVRADQWPTTTWEALHRALSGGGSARPDATPPGAGDGFNLDALR